MWVVLCDPSDDSALWAHTQLRERGLAPLELVSPQDLVWSERCAHRIDRAGARFEIDLSDGRKLASSDINGALNRAIYAPVTHHPGSPSQSDARYAAMELAALLLSWLSSIATVCINQPTARGLSGVFRAPAEWAVLAAESGLTVQPVPLSSKPLHATPLDSKFRTLIVFDDRVFGGETTPQDADACIRLAHLANTRLLGITFQLDAYDRTFFTGATPVPDLRIGGDALIECLHQRLMSRD